jgi:hypothetical protein
MSLAAWRPRSSGCWSKQAAASKPGFSDRDLAESVAEIVESDELYQRSQVVACVNAVRRSGQLHRGQIMLGMLRPWRHPMLIEYRAGRGVTMVSLDRVPRLPEALGIDVTPTQARIAGRDAVLLAEQHVGLAALTHPPAIVGPTILVVTHQPYSGLRQAGHNAGGCQEVGRLIHVVPAGRRRHGVVSGDRGGIRRDHQQAESPPVRIGHVQDVPVLMVESLQTYHPTVHTDLPWRHIPCGDRESNPADPTQPDGEHPGQRRQFNAQVPRPWPPATVDITGFRPLWLQAQS